MKWPINTGAGCCCFWTEETVVLWSGRVTAEDLLWLHIASASLYNTVCYSSITIRTRKKLRSAVSGRQAAEVKPLSWVWPTAGGPVWRAASVTDRSILYYRICQSLHGSSLTEPLCTQTRPAPSQTQRSSGLIRLLKTAFNNSVNIFIFLSPLIPLALFQHMRYFWHVTRNQLIISPK